jgi:transcription-repair coupling factor (superfamily II helicase)
MRDMELRGVGALLGTKQSGIINSIGFNFYNRMLEGAVANIQDNKPAFAENEDEKEHRQRLQIESDFYFPADYISDDKERLSIYREMLQYSSEEEFDELEKSLNDRFGRIPDKAVNAIYYFKMNMLIKSTSLTSFKLKKGWILLEFDNKLLPSRDKIEKIVRKFPLPVQFSTTGSFVIKFNLSSKNYTSFLDQIRTGLEIVSFLKTIESTDSVVN